MLNDARLLCKKAVAFHIASSHMKVSISSNPPREYVLSPVNPTLCEAPAGPRKFPPAPRDRGGEGFGMSVAQIRCTRRQGAPEAGDQAALSWRERGVPQVVPSRQRRLAPYALSLASPLPATSAKPAAQPRSGPRPAPSATRRESRQPPAHLLGACPPVKARLDWRGGDEVGVTTTLPRPALVGILKRSWRRASAQSAVAGPRSWSCR